MRHTSVSAIALLYGAPLAIASFVFRLKKRRRDHTRVYARLHRIAAALRDLILLNRILRDLVLNILHLRSDVSVYSLSSTLENHKSEEQGDKRASNGNNG